MNTTIIFLLTLLAAALGKQEIHTAVLFSGHPRAALKEPWIIDSIKTHLIYPLTREGEVHTFLSVARSDKSAMHIVGDNVPHALINKLLNKFYRINGDELFNLMTKGLHFLPDATEQDTNYVADRLKASRVALVGEAAPRPCTDPPSKFRHLGGQVQMFQKIRAAYEMALEYQQQRSIEYAYFVRARFDLAWLYDPMPLNWASDKVVLHSPNVDVVAYVRREAAGEFFQMEESMCVVEDTQENVLLNSSLETNEELIERHLQDHGMQYYKMQFPVAQVLVSAVDETVIQCDRVAPQFMIKCKKMSDAVDRSPSNRRHQTSFHGKHVCVSQHDGEFKDHRWPGDRFENCFQNRNYIFRLAAACSRPCSTLVRKLAESFGRHDELDTAAIVVNNRKSPRIMGQWSSSGNFSHLQVLDDTYLSTRSLRAVQVLLTMPDNQTFYAPSFTDSRLPATKAADVAEAYLGVKDDRVRAWAASQSRSSSFDEIIVDVVTGKWILPADVSFITIHVGLSEAYFKPVLDVALTSISRALTVVLEPRVLQVAIFQVSTHCPVLFCS